MNREQLVQEVEAAWIGEIENRDIRGKLRRALLVYCNKDVRDLLEGLEQASADVHQAWSTFLTAWVSAEVMRICRDLEHPIHGTAWEQNRQKARRQAKCKLKPLQSKIIAYVSHAGGTIDFAPAHVAKALAKSKRSLSVANVEKAMHRMCRARVAKKLEVRRGIPAKFVLL